MPFSRAIVNFQNLEDRLRRLLGLAGEIGSSFEPQLKPVVVAGDLREAGLSSYRGRHWGYASDALAGVGKVAQQVFVLQFQERCLVDGVFAIGIGPDSRVNAHVIAPDAGAALFTPAGQRSCGTWTDNKMFTADACPLLDTANVGLGGAAPFAGLTVQNRFASWSTPAASGSNGDAQRQLNGMMIPAGGQIVWDTSFVALQVSQFQVGAWGRIF